MKSYNILSLVIGVCVLLVSSCKKDAVETKSTDNPAIKVELLFEYDGVKVYRFEDSGAAIYYTDARGKTTWEQGKNGKKTVETVGD